MSAYSYDNRKKAMDPSILGTRPHELAEMDDEERKEALFDALMRASDLLGEVAKAFSKDLGGDKDDVVSAARSVSGVARKMKR